MKTMEKQRLIVDADLNFAHNLTYDEYLRLAEQCVEDLVGIDIPVSTNIYFTINARAKRRFGQCRKLPLYESQVKGFDYEIQISNELIKKGINLKAFKQVVYHELIHSISGCMNHGHNFKKYANKINCIYNTDIERTTSYENLGIKNADEIKNIKYIIKCNDCGQLIKRSKYSKLVANCSDYICGCGGKLTRIK